jgi:tetratricopeptide (TPR) repeat protein
MYSSSLQDFVGAQASFNKAKGLIAPVFRARPGDSDVALIRLEIEDSLAGLLYHSGRRAEAAAAYQSLLPEAHRLGGMRPRDVTAAKQESFLHLRLAAALHYDDAERGLEHAKQAMAQVRDLMQRFPADKSLKQDFGVGLAAVAASLVVAGELRRAEEFYRQSIELREDLLRDDPKDMTAKRNLIVVYGNYASILGVPWMPNLGRASDARAAAAKAVAIARSMAALDPQDQTARVNLAMSLFRLGSIDPEAGGSAASLAILREATEMFEPIVRSNPKSGGIAVGYATALEYTGHRLMAMGQPANAEAKYRASLAAVEAFLATGNSSAVVQQIACYQALASLYSSKADRKNAVDYAQKAVAAAVKYSEGQKTDTRVTHLARSYSVLATVYAKFGELENARLAASHALALWKPITHAGILEMNRKEIAEANALAASSRAGL